jgi:hypothetical protein
MPLGTLKNLKIEAFTVAMKYGTRDNFAAHRQALIDSIRRETITILRAAKKGGIPEANVDDDGDLSFEYEHSGFHFRLDVRPDIAAGQFKQLYDHALALQIIKGFYTQLVQVLNLQDADVFTLDFKNVFDLVKSAPKNYAVLQHSLLPTMREVLNPLINERSQVARIDFKLGWHYDDRHACYLTIECPGNEENTTVWTTLNVRTREDIVVIVDQQHISDDIDKAYELYCGEYAQTVERLLSDVDLDLDRRRLMES